MNNGAERLRWLASFQRIAPSEPNKQPQSEKSVCVCLGPATVLQHVGQGVFVFSRWRRVESGGEWRRVGEKRVSKSSTGGFLVASLTMVLDSPCRLLSP